MMRSFTCLIAGAALIIGLLGCTDDSDDSSTTNASQTGDGDGDGATGETGTNTGDGDGDGDGDCTPGTIGCACDNGMCNDGLSCDEATNTCSLGGGDGDGDGDGDGAPAECMSDYDPSSCAPPAQLLSVMDLEGNFCGCPCTMHTDCPMGPADTQGACVITLMGNTPEYCALTCTPPSMGMGMMGTDACPEGSTCKEVPDQPGFGLCTYP